MDVNAHAATILSDVAVIVHMNNLSASIFLHNFSNLPDPPPEKDSAMYVLISGYLVIYWTPYQYPKNVRMYVSQVISSE